MPPKTKKYINQRLIPLKEKRIIKPVKFFDAYEEEAEKEDFHKVDDMMNIPELDIQKPELAIEKTPNTLSINSIRRENFTNSIFSQPNISEGTLIPEKKKIYSQNSLKERPRSVVSEDFLDLENGKVKCLYCQNIITWKQGEPTSNLLRHLKRCIKCPEEKQSTLDLYLKKTSKLTKDIQNELNYWLCRIVSINERTLNLMDSDEFVEFCRILNSAYKIPVYNTIWKSLIFYQNQARENLVKEVEKITSFVVTSDLWKSNTQNNFLTLEIHYINESWTKLIRTLACKSVKEITVSGDILQEYMKTIFEQSGVNIGKVIHSVCDGGSNLVKAFKNLVKSNDHCGTHALNLIVKNPIHFIMPILQKPKELVSLFKKSSKAWRQLVYWQEEDNLMEKEKEKDFEMVIYSIISDVDTRWNSLYLMISRLILLWDCISLFCIEENMLNFIKKEDLMLWEKLCSLWKPFWDATNLLSYDHIPTINYLLPTFYDLKNHLNSFTIENDLIQSYVKGMIVELNKEIENYKKSQFCLLGAFLDIDYASFNWAGEDKDAFLLSCEIFLLSRIERMDLNPIIPMQTTTKSKLFHKPATGIVKDFLQSSSTFQQESNVVFKDRKTLAKEEIGKYISLVEKHKKDIQNGNSSQSEDDVLLWWKKNDQFPLLKLVAKEILCSPAGSVVSERNGSQLGRIATKLRNRLTDEHITILNFLKQNKDLW